MWDDNSSLIPCIDVSLLGTANLGYETFAIGSLLKHVAQCLVFCHDTPGKEAQLVSKEREKSALSCGGLCALRIGCFANVRLTILTQEPMDCAGSLRIAPADVQPFGP